MTEIIWLRPCGNPDSKYGGLTICCSWRRLLTSHVPSASCVFNRYWTPFSHARLDVGSRPASCSATSTSPVAYASHEAGRLPTSNLAWLKGVQYLLKTQ